MAKKSESIAPMASVASGAAVGQAIMPGLCLPPRVSWSENATTCHNSNDQCKIFRRRQLEISVASLGVQRCKGQEAEREPRGLIVLRVPLEGGGRLVVSVNDDEAKELHKVLAGVVKK